MNRKVPAQRLHHTVWRRSGHKKKKFSDGVRATFQAISRHWKRDIKTGKGTIVEKSQELDEFVNRFQKIYRRIVKHYGGLKGPNKNIKRMVRDLNAGTVKLPFHLQRAYAEYVGVPTGVLMIFTNIVSDATQKTSKADLLNKLESSQQAIAALIDFLKGDTRVDVSLFNDLPGKGDGRHYEAKLEGLEKMVKAYQATRKAYAK